MIGNVYEWLAIASVLLIVLLGILIPMVIRRRRNGGNGNTLFTVLGIAAALDFMLLGVLIPKALLVRAEDRYLTVEWSQDSGGSSIEPRATAAPLPGEGHELEIVWLWEAQNLIQDESDLLPREPLSFEMSMEQAVQTARNELDLLSSLGALTGLDKDDLRFKSGELRGHQSASFESELGSSPGMPWGLWIITFEDGEGRPIELKCDSQNGCVYSVAFRRDAAVSDFICFSSLIGYAKYFGLPMQGAVLDDNNAGTYFLSVSGVQLVYTETDSRGMTSLSLFVPGEQAVGMPTPLPTLTPTPEPTKTPKPAPASTPTPIPTAATSPVSSGEPEGTPGN
ncbi:MAG: hypothetical protein IKH31_01155 [Clostridia bacterium]|nr:hypothetical protein [Clostridia bacterium]